MILPNPDPWFSRRTCHHLAFAAAVSEASTLLALTRRTADQDLDLLRVTRCGCECAGLIDPLEGSHDQRVRAGLLLARAARHCRHYEAADHADHLRTLARSVIETLTDEHQRAHLTHILDGTTGDSPSRSARYRPRSVITC